MSKRSRVLAFPPRYNPPVWLKRVPSTITQSIAGTGKQLDQIVTEDMISMAFWGLIEAKNELETAAAMKSNPDWDERRLAADQPNPAVREAALQVLHEFDAKHMALCRDATFYENTMAEALNVAVDAVTELVDIMERVKSRLLLRIQDSGYLRLIAGQYSSITEYLLSKADPTVTGGVNSPIAYLIEVLIPVLRNAGISEDLIFNVAQNFEKAKRAVPAISTYLLAPQTEKVKKLRIVIANTLDPQVLKTLEDEYQKALKLDQDTLDKLMEIISDIVTSPKDGGPTVAQFSIKLDHMIRSVSGRREEEAIVGYVYNVPEGGVLQVRISDIKKMRAFINATSKFVDWHLASPVDMARQAQAALLQEEE